MQSWYRAICDQHREVCQIFVHNHTASKIVAAYPADATEAAMLFLSDHYTCRLRLVRDDSEDWPDTYVDRTPP